MAAYAALVSAARTLDECCNDINTVSGCGLDHGKEDEEIKILLESLLQRFYSLEAFLEDFREEAENLEGRIRDVAYKTEDFMLKLQQQIRSDHEEESCCGHFQDLIEELHKVIIQEVQSIEEEVGKIKIIATSSGVARNLQIKSSDDYSKDAPPTTSTGKGDVVMVGFDDQLTAIKEGLCGHSSKLQVIPISGMGGIGKTTLARNAFDDRLIKEQFHLHAWASVSQAYSLREIFLSLLVSCNILKDKTNKEGVERLVELTYKSLKGRRYLIVLDDVWTTKAWDEVRRVFPDDNNGSRILLTTRLSEVAEYAAGATGSGTDILIHSVQFLDADQSWNLLREKVFFSSSSPTSHDDNQESHYPNINCPETLEDIGKTIARKCGGLPLTIVVVAGILQNVNGTRAAWEEIARKVNAVAVAESSRDERVANVLSLSYKHLPHHLRPCLLYMAGFPEDYVMNALDLFRLWTAEGFIKQQPINTRSSSSSSSSSAYNSKRFEETTAEEYLEDLVRRNLIVVVRRDISSGRILSCSLHDLLRDMCVGKAHKEKFLQRLDHHLQQYYSGEPSPRRVSIDYMNNGLCDKIVSEIYPTTIRTILSFQKIHDNISGSDAYDNSLSSIAAKRSLFSVFHAPEIRFKQFPTPVLRLFHLRYLNFRYFYYKQMPHLPEDMYKLKKLQSLVLRNVCLELPFNIWSMPQLRHLQVGMLCLQPHDAEITTTLTTLENLQTLSSVNKLVCTETVMKSMPNLKLLKLYYYNEIMEEVIMDLSDFQIENLVHLHRLESLHLEVSSEVKSVASLSEKLALPATLRELTLIGCMLAWEKIGSIGSSLPKLQVLALDFNACRGEVWETKEGQFPQLKVLQLSNLNLEQWIIESSDHFPCLKKLDLYGCRRLLEIPDGIGDIPTLQSIEITYCSESAVESAKGIKRQQEDIGNEDLRVRIKYRGVYDENGLSREVVQEF